MASEEEQKILRYLEEVKSFYANAFSQPEKALPRLSSAFSELPHSPDVQQQFSLQVKTIFRRFEMGLDALLGVIFDLLRAEGHSAEPPNLLQDYSNALTHLVAMAMALRSNNDFCISVLLQGETLQEALGITDGELDALYQGVRYLFEQQYYSEAAAAFSFLTFIAPVIPIFWMGLGTCEYHLQRYEAALLAYAMAAQADGLDPLPHLFSAQCYELVNEKERALQSLELARIVLSYSDQISEQEAAKLKEKIDAKAHDLQRSRGTL